MDLEYYSGRFLRTLDDFEGLDPCQSTGAKIYAQPCVYKSSTSFFINGSIYYVARTLSKGY